MAGRRVHNREFGAYLKALRESKTLASGKPWSQSDAARFARDLRLSALNRLKIVNLENGRTQNPKPDVLRAVAALYGVPWEELSAKYTASRGLASDLLRHGSDVHRGTGETSNAQLVAVRQNYDALRTEMLRLVTDMHALLIAHHANSVADVSGQTTRRTGTRSRSRR